MEKIEKNSKVLLVVLVLLFLSLFYGKVLWSPNSYLFGVSGDAMKNYFTYASQIKESSYSESVAMNYPYGENFLYLDCQPAFTAVIKTMSKLFPFVADNSIGITNFLLIFSIGISAWLLYLILLRFSVRPILAVISAISISILAPQIVRIDGHFALGYSFFIPLSWYLYLRFNDSQKKWKWSVLMCLNTLFWFFTHAYLGMIIVTFILTCFVIDGIVSLWEKKLDIRFLGYLILQTLFPLLFFWGYATFTDIHTGRTENPFGFMESSSNFDSVFYPNREPLKPLVDRYVTLEQNWEGWAYIGIGSVLGIVIFILFFLYNLIRNRRFSFTESGLPKPLLISVVASVIVLLISFGYPFRWGTMEDLLDKFPVIKNFRGIGRFAWVFFYVITVAVISFTFNSFISKKTSYPSFILVALISFSFVYEGIPYHKSKSEVLTLLPNYFDKDQIDNELKYALKNVDFSKYQAIVPLPYYHIGSENFGKEATDKMYRLSMLLGYHSGLPILSNYSTRTSIWESKNVMQVISPQFYKKAIEQDIKDDRPFVIIYSHEELLDCEQNILDRSKELYKNKDLTLFEISKDELLSYKPQKWIEHFGAIEKDLIIKNDFLLSSGTDSSYLYYESYDNHPGNIVFSGKGSMACKKKDFTILKEFQKDELKYNHEYVASFWLYNSGYNHGQDVGNGLLFFQVNQDEQNFEWLKVENMSVGLNIYGDWSLIEIKFKVPEILSHSYLVLKGNDRSKITWHIDDLLIREAGVDVYKVLSDNKNRDKVLFMNNHRIPFKQ